MKIVVRTHKQGGRIEQCGYLANRGRGRFRFIEQTSPMDNL